MKVVAFSGSPRIDGNTDHLIKRVFSILNQEGIETEMIRIGGKTLQGCTACMKCYDTKDRRCVIPDDEMNHYIEKMNCADAIILASPTYFADVSSEMKALIDRAGMVSKANGDMLQRKVGASLVAVRRGGAIHTFDTMNHFFLISQMIIVGSSYWNFGLGRAPGEVEEDSEGMVTMDILAKNMAWLMRKLC